MCSCSAVQESMWWNGNQIRDNYALLGGKVESKCHQNFSEDSRFPIMHSHK